ncbi:MAG TPA: LuxR C-terminal-related transcriptional regulator [Gaiellaceae bacterium]|nr:LuxR C-terminal-related transcriptional regulator [Gaiellaceae bacterium]
MITEADLLEELRTIAPDLAPSIAKLPMPAYILDRNGVVRWLNMAAVRHFGDIRGMRIGQLVEPEFATRARQEFAAKLLGTVQSTEGTVAVRTTDGRRVEVDISSTQLLEHGSVVGVFGLADPTDEPPRPLSNSVELTPRQLDVLRYIAGGHSTEHIATALGISTETVRNHVRHLMGRLNVHTRLEAVIRGHELGLV